MRDTLASFYESATDTKDRITETWPYSAIDDLTGRLSSWAIGPHSYGPQEDKDELKEDIYLFKPPKNGYDKEEYLEEVNDILEKRTERLEQQQEDPTAVRAARVKLDEVAYIVARGGLVAGGGSLLYSATFSPSILYTMWGYTAGPAMLAGAPIGVKSALEEINEYRDPETVEDDLAIYNEALNELEEDGTDAIPDDFSKWVNVPGVGKKKVSFSLEDGEYRRE